MTEEVAPKDIWATPETNASEFPISATHEVGAYELITKYSTDFLSIHNASGDYVFASGNVEQLFGWRPEELVGRNLFEFFHCEDAERVATDRAEQSGAIPRMARYRLRCSDGSYRWVETRSRTRRTPAGVQIVCVTRDTHKLIVLEARAEAAERELAEARQAEVVAKFAAALGHEINNPLTILEMSLAVLEHQGNDVSALRTALRRIHSVVAELSLLSNPAHGRDQDISLPFAVDRLVRLLGMWGKRIHAPALPNVRINLNPARLYQLLHATFVAHLESSEDDQVTVESEIREDTVVLTITGGEAAARVRTNLLGVLRGDPAELESDLPVRLVERIAASLGVSCHVDMVDSQLRTELILPVARAS